MENESIEKSKKKPSLVFFLVYTLLTIVALLPYAPIFIDNNNVIPWEDAENHIDDGVYAVEGNIASVKYAKHESGKPIFIDVGEPYPNYGRTTIVIWEENQKHFKMEPKQIAKYYKSRIGEKIVVSGFIEVYDNHYEIDVEYPQQIGVDGNKAQKHFMRSMVLAFLIFLVYTVYLGLLWGTMRNVDDNWKEGTLYKVVTVYYLCLGALVVGKLLYTLFFN